MDISKILQIIRPNCVFSVIGNSYEGINWMDDESKKPTFDDIKNAWESGIRQIAEWEPVRQQRNLLLSESDYTQLNDSKVSNKEDWAVYRQKLRDITSNFGSASEVIWPIKP